MKRSTYTKERLFTTTAPGQKKTLSCAALVDRLPPSPSASGRFYVVAARRFLTHESARER